jgi:hypothetical protein
LPLSPSAPLSAPPSAPSPSRATAYSRADRLLHRIALGVPAVVDLSFDLEKARFGRAAQALSPRPPIFVTGLARAGTTVIMQRIHAADTLAALRYRDLPFPLAPNTWAALTAGRTRSVETRERGHGDGLTHDLDSPEAIEEVFWRLREGHHYLSPTRLSAHDPDPASLADFALFARLVCLRYGCDRYLSKNNANVLRLDALAGAFPGAVLVHPFRAPLEQAASLLAQHRRARDLGRADAFRAAFMRWLGHHEFGVDQRAILVPPGDADTLAFWLRTWIAVHRHLLARPTDVAAMQCFVDYDRLALGDPGVLARLARRLALPGAIPAAGLRPPPPYRIHDGVPDADRAEAEAIHTELRQRA